MDIQSKNQTILVLSDPHQDVDRLERILLKESYDTVVCLGDWWDSWHKNTDQYVIDTCKFLVEWLPKSNFFSVIGNHDVPYLFNNINTACGGCNRGQLVRATFGDQLIKFREMFKWYIWIDNFLCTHAGVHPVHFSPQFKVTKKNVTTWLDKEIKSAEIVLPAGGSHWMCSAGQARCGRLPKGGITWLDFDEEFEPIKGLKQIVGHTAHKNVVSIGSNYDIDCFLNEWITIRNGKVTLRTLSDLD